VSRDGARIAHRGGVGPESPGNSGSTGEDAAPPAASGEAAAAGGAGLASDLSPSKDKSPGPPPSWVSIPRSVCACHVGAWHLRLIHKGTGEVKCVEFRCGSWRHAGDCAKARAADDARRIREGVEKYGRPMAYLVLTFDPKRFVTGARDAYRVLVRCWAKLYKRLVRRWGRAPYCLLVEEHRNQWPHVNALLGGHVGTEVAAGRWREVRREMRPMIEESGFGQVIWVDAKAASPALPQYIAKYCTKVDQAPVHAPRKFRRLRASRGFLGKARAKGELFTGWLIKTPVPDVHASGAGAEGRTAVASCNANRMRIIRNPDRTNRSNGPDSTLVPRRPAVEPPPAPPRLDLQLEPPT
jgi:hypothetical protein